MAESKTIISDGSNRKIEELAREQHCDPGQVLDEAVRRYAAVRRLERLADRGEQRARALGLQEEDVPRLVEEVRRENRDRSR